MFRDKVGANERATNSHYEAVDKRVYHLYSLQKKKAAKT